MERASAPSPQGPGETGTLCAAKSVAFVRLHYYSRDVVVETLDRDKQRPKKAPDREALDGSFSRKSMKRLVFLANNLRVGWKSLLTLTYPETWPVDQEVSKEHLRMMLQKIGRKFPGMLYLWVREFQSRGAVHYHCLLTVPIEGERMRLNKPDGTEDKETWSSKPMHKWASQQWQKCIKDHASEAGLKAGIRWEHLKSERGGAAYMAEYLGKSDQKKLPGDCENGGRWWAHSQSIGKLQPDRSIIVPIADYLASVGGKKVSQGGWLFGTLHDGAARAACFLPDRDGGTDSHRTGRRGGLTLRRVNP